MSCDWLPDALLSVADRLARADQCAYEIAGLISSWSLAGPLEMEQVWVDKEAQTYEVRISGVRPAPPMVALLFSEGIHHVRATLDNVVWYLTEQVMGSISDRQARQVQMPIYDDVARYRQWVERVVKNGLDCFDDSATLGQRILSLQPFKDTHQSVESFGQLLGELTGAPRDLQHPLSLLQGYSNADKHRHVRLAMARSTAFSFDRPFFDQDRVHRPLEVGDVLASGVWGKPNPLETNTAATIQRPGLDGVWVNPSRELGALRQYVADVAIPVLILGLELSHGVPPEVDLSDRGATDRERISSAGNRDFAERFAPRLTEMWQSALEAGYHWPEPPRDA